MGDERDDEIERLRARIASLEAKLDRVSAHLQAIFANIPANMYVKDLENRYVYGSPYGFRMFGIDPAGALGKTDAELFSPELAARFVASDRRVLDGAPLEEISYSVPVPGGPRHFAGVRFVIPDASGSPIGVCGIGIDVTKRIELELQLELLAITDPLTGLANRRRFDEHLSVEMARAARNNAPLSLVICDVDHFKRYNDRYGHLRGDAALVAVAGVLANAVRRPADLVARYGGEEFAIVLPETAEPGALRLIERIWDAVRALAIEHDGNDGRGMVTISAGIATVTGGWAAADVIALADAALYEAKATGRNRYALSREERPPASVAREP
jgi:diguanylate cyclase (GGDEF)-like protein/PAS domain S-box-containing protein